MAQLVVGGVTIPVAPGNASRDRDDFTDRRRAFDGTYRASQTGGAARTWRFRTPPITRVLADSYEATLGLVAAQMCSGDLLGIPTMCCAQIDSGWNAIKAASGHYVELPFTLHEVQPAKLLLKYAPGDTITGESFSRSTAADYYSNQLVVTSAAVNVKRDSHYAAAGASRSILLEGGRTNRVTASDSFTGWTDTGVTIGATAADPYGGSTAPLLSDAAGGNARYTAVALSGNGTKALSIFAKKNGSTNAMVALFDVTAAVFRSRVQIAWSGGGVPTVTLESGAGTIYTPEALTGGWYRIRFAADSAVAANTNRMYIYPSQTGAGSVYFMGAQTEDAAFPSSYIPTTAGAVTKGADSYSLPHTTPPQEATFYAKFIEGGTIATAGAHLFGLEASTDAAPLVMVYAPSGLYTAYHNNGTATVTSALAAAPSIGDTVEICVRLYGDGSVDILQSLNAGASTTGAQSSANALAAAWSGPLAWINSVGATNLGFASFQSLKIVAGMRSLAEMRTL